MKIALLGAMEEEIAPLLSQVGEYKSIELANNTYHLAQYAGHELIIAYSKIGKVFSTLTVTMAIDHFGAECVLFTGVAGGGEGLKVGDLVVATQTVQHDVDISAFGRLKGELPGMNIYTATDEALRVQLLKVATKLDIAVVEGVIATGDQFVSDANKKHEIISSFNAKAIEMEGASVNLVCHELNIPSLILRAISDTADGDAIEDFPVFLKHSAERSASLVLKLVKQL